MLRFICQIPELMTAMCRVSIHLMLRFIGHCTLYSFGLYRFQYISCYGLSLWTFVQKRMDKKFQYISCYGLSEIDCYPTGDDMLFQYISCYGLSTFSHFRHACQNVSIHLMLRFICTQISCSHIVNRVSIHLMLRFIIFCPNDEPKTSGFNTSHVTVYLKCSCR